MFVSKGYEETSVSDIMEVAGWAKGMFYRCFRSKEEVMYALGKQMFYSDGYHSVCHRLVCNGIF